MQNDIGGVNQNKSFSPPYTPELNGIAERVNRTMVEAALSMLIQANLPSYLWPFALKHAIHVRNRVPHSATGKTPYLVMTGHKPSLKHFRVFGCAAYVLRQPSGSKFESRAVEGVYLETLDHGVYKVLITTDIGIPRIVESRHVTFDESTFPGAPALEEYMEDESSSDDDYDSDSSHSESGNEESDYGDVSDEESNGQEVAVQETESHELSNTSSSSDNDDDYHDADAETVPPAPQTTEISRYPTRQRRKPPT